MATRRPSGAFRLINRLINAGLRLGFGPARTYRLSVPGRRSGRIQTTPVTLVEQGEQRWLVAPYGAVDWVLNARAAGHVELSRGGRTERVTVRELTGATSAPVLKRYLTEVPITRSYFTATATAPLEAFAAEAERHPVFAIEPIASR